MYALSDAALVRALRRLRGTPDAVLQHQQYLEFLLPVVRADLAVCDTNQSRHQQLLACPIRAYAGEADSVVSTEELAEWQRDTAGSFEMTLFPGGHFFLYEESPDAFLSTLSDHLMQLVGSGCSLNAFTAS
jgi:surfactin synthase thioesterase subunit